MTTPLAVAVFLLGAIASLSSSWVLVSRVERIGARIGASEAMLGLLAALAADTPEIVSAVSALAQHQQAVGSGVVIGSNVFNLAALLGLGAVVAGGIALHRRVVLLTGAIAVWVAIVCCSTVAGITSPAIGLVLVLVALVPYILLAALGAAQPADRSAETRLRRWLRTAVAEEEMELSAAIHPRKGRPLDVVVASVALAIVVGASVAVERAASTLGVRLGVPDIVVGGVVLAAVTSLPNVVAAIYLAQRGRGAAMMSESLNSNALNVAAGFLVPAAVLGMGQASGPEMFIALWYIGLTSVTLVLAFCHRGLRRAVGLLILVAYAAFVADLIATAATGNTNIVFLVGPPVLFVAASCVMLLRPSSAIPGGQNPAAGPYGGSTDNTNTL